MNKHRRAATLTGIVATVTFIALGLVSALNAENALVDALEISAVPVVLTDHDTEETFTDPYKWARATNLPIAEDMDASAGDIETLITLAASAESAVSADDQMAVDLPNMSTSLLGDRYVEACLLVQRGLGFPHTRSRAAAVCDDLGADYRPNKRLLAWLAAGSHFARQCEDRFTTYRPNTDPERIAKHDATVVGPITFTRYIVPASGIEAGDEGALAAQDIAQRVEDRLNITVTEPNCLIYDPDLAHPVSLDADGNVIPGGEKS